jgi:hypothetical protein
MCEFCSCDGAYCPVCASLDDTLIDARPLTTRIPRPKPIKARLMVRSLLCQGVRLERFPTRRQDLAIAVFVLALGAALSFALAVAMVVVRPY